MATREWFSRLSSYMCVILTAGLLVCPSTAFAQAPDTPQALQAEIDQLKKDFDAIKQQYGDRLSALESKLAAVEGTPPAAGATPAGSAHPPRSPLAAAPQAGGRARSWARR